MKETEWVSSFVQKLSTELVKAEHKNLKAGEGKKLSYANEIRWYNTNGEETETIPLKYETDILIYEEDNNVWKPRVVIEAKKDTVTTHDAITYSQKALTHKHVHPYLRYGILIGNRLNYPLPGRLFRHGINFDFMLSWVHLNPTDKEWEVFIQIILDEVEASKYLEEMIFNSRSSQRKQYTMLHKPLIIKKIDS
jgi:hypothetical protein